MGFKSINVLLDRESNIYYPGQTIYGQVKLIADSPKKVRGIIVRFVGEAKTKWTKKSKNKTTIYKDTEKYFNTQQYVLGSANNPDIVLPSGTNTYRFSHTLPLTLPSSFESEFGYIRYTIKVILDRPWKINTDMVIPFTVLAPFHIKRSRLNKPFEMSLEKSFYSFCCNSGQLSVTTSIPMRGYVSGKSLLVTCNCDNASNVGVHCINLVLFKCVTYKAKQPQEKQKIVKETVADIVTGPVTPGGLYTFTENIEIPALPNLLSCSIITVDYDLHVQCIVRGLHRNLAGKLRLEIVNVPPIPNNDIMEP